jgi:HEPN domain-containing protein
MNNRKMALSYLKDAERIFEEAKISFKNKHWHRVVRKSQEASELAGKALLRYFGIEYPKKHFLGKIVEKLKLKEVEKLAFYLDSLASEREKAFYGTEFLTPEEIFSKKDAELSMKKCKWVIKFVKRHVK